MAQLNFKWLLCGRLANKIRFMTNWLIAPTYDNLATKRYCMNKSRSKWKIAWNSKDFVEDFQRRRKKLPIATDSMSQERFVNRSACNAVTKHI